MDRLAGKVAIITGAGRGIGRAITEGFATEGARMLVADRDRANVEAVAAAIGAECLPFEVDVARAEQAPGLIRAAVERFGRLDILVNNAGVSRPLPLLEIDEDDWDRVLSVNLRGAFFCAQAAARIMVEQGAGSIIFVSSQLVFAPRRGAAHYIASKAGVWGLTQAMALDLGSHGVRVNAIMPGVTETEINRARLAIPGERDADLRRIALGRLGAPRDLAGAAIFLASDEAAYVTGAALRVDGGWLA